MLHQKVRQPHVRLLPRTIAPSLLTGAAIATALTATLLSTLGFAIQGVAAPSARSASPARPGFAAELPDYSSSARDLSPISQPAPMIQPLPVPVAPGTIQQDTSRAGGDLGAIAVPSSGWLMQINNETQRIPNQTPSPVVRPFEQPAADQIIIGTPLQ
jgi:hypothetical protein